MIPKELRHALGEYYTPDWLAEWIVRQAAADPGGGCSRSGWRRTAIAAPPSRRSPPPGGPDGCCRTVRRRGPRRFSGSPPAIRRSAPPSFPRAGGEGRGPPPPRRLFPFAGGTGHLSGPRRARAGPAQAALLSLRYAHCTGRRSILQSNPEKIPDSAVKRREVSKPRLSSLPGCVIISLIIDREQPSGGRREEGESLSCTKSCPGSSSRICSPICYAWPCSPL